MPRLEFWIRLAAFVFSLTPLLAIPAFATDEVQVETGRLAGTTNADKTARIFKGIPFAAPPVGDLRWKAPQPPRKWDGVRAADKFGSPCMQTDVFGDIYFRDASPSEDCLNLTIWIPVTAASGKIPVFLWFYGGGYVAGGNSEARYDGENLAKKGIIVVEPNYRLGAFGFLSHPELTKESGHHSSGNYGLLDQVAALQWVIRNIEAFGGDPHNITIGGESAGSFSVSTLLASPLSRGLFQKAIGESGAFFPLRNKDVNLTLRPRSETEKVGLKLAASLAVKSLAGLRAKSGEEVLQAAAKMNRGFDFGPNIDGYYLTSDIETIYERRKQSPVPLLAGWNADEGKGEVLTASEKPTAHVMAAMAKQRFGDDAGEFLKLFPARNDQEALRSAEQLAGDDFIIYSTWKWVNLQTKAGAPVYTYRFEQLPPSKPGAVIGGIPMSEFGARHACEIEYVFQTLKSMDAPWSEQDFQLSDLMSSYWANFVKTGNPGASGLPDWPAYKKYAKYPIMHLSGQRSQAAPESDRARYEFLDAHRTQMSDTKAGSQ